MKAEEQIVCHERTAMGPRPTVSSSAEVHTELQSVKKRAACDAS